VNRSTLALGLMLGLGIAAPAHALQCVPYARQISGLDLQGDAWRWWTAAQGVYDRGISPQVGAVLVFKQTAHMRRGHVAVVRRVINKREIRIDHANWGTGLGSGRGDVSLDVAVLDVSANNDWSQVRVWHHGSGTFGNRVNPSFGFIYSKERSRHNRLDDVAAQPHVIHAVSVTTLPTTTTASTLTVDAQHQDITLVPPTSTRTTGRRASAAHLNAQVLADLQPQTAPASSTATTKSTGKRSKYAHVTKKGGVVIKVSKTSKATTTTTRSSSAPANGRTPAAK